MSESFDPYRVWLAIPPESRPPTHYELLGVSPQENDPAVINAAMLRQSGYVRNFQIGKYAQEAARVLNEIAAAKACLLDPAKRAKYDSDLRTRQTAASRAKHQAAAPLAPPPLRPAIDLDQLAASAALSAAAPLSRRTGATRRFVTPRNKRKPSVFPWRVTVAVAATVAVVGIGFDMLGPRGEMATNEPPTAENRPTESAQSGGQPGTTAEAGPAEPPAKNQSPSVEIVSSEPPDPKAGDSLTIRLAGHDPEGDAITFEYRKGADGAWRIAPDGLVSLVQLEAGPLDVQVRARDGRSALSEIVTRAYEVKDAVPPAAIAPFSAEQARRYQEAWAKYLECPIVETNSIGMKLTLIPPGEFQMGSPPSEAGRGEYEVQRLVQIAEPFYLGVFEVTQKEYQGVMGTNPSHFSQAGAGKDAVRGLDTSHFPVENVSWDDGVEFCRRISASPAEQSAGRVYRLPTEAEWEYTCRAGTTTPFHFGDELNGMRANCDGQQPYGTSGKGPRLGRTEAVGSHAPNPFGIWDMHGNVLEWCADGGETGNAQHRGGGWVDPASHCRSAFRRVCPPGLRIYHLGFRVAVEDARYKARDLLSRAVAWYRADGNADDSADKHHGKLLGGASIAPIKVGQAFDFDGKNGSVVVPDAPELNPSKEFTVMAWIRPRVVARSDSLIISKIAKASGDAGYEFLLSPDNALLIVAFNAVGEPRRANALGWLPRPIVAGEWSHHAGTYDGEVLHSYLNGAHISAYRCGTKTVAPSHAKFRISGDDDGNFCFNGLTDDVAFFNRALSNTEIETICRGTFISHRPRGQSDE